MIDLNAWIRTVPGAAIVPLFDTEPGSLTVRTRDIEKNGKTLLCRHPLMEETMISLVEAGIARPDFQGIFYIMGYDRGDQLVPLYVGKAERKGVKHDLSENLRNIRRNRHKFARWGDGLDYHIGDLSHATFRFEGYRGPRRKYELWAQALFMQEDPPVLKEPVSLVLVPWYDGMVGPSGLKGSLPAVEKEVIALASVQHGADLLNVDGR